MTEPRSQTYHLPTPPIPWKRAGVSYSKFYDTQKHLKISTGLLLLNQHNNQPLFSGPISIDITFFMPVPKTRKEIRNKLRARQLVYHSHKPDIDNLCKFLFDACTGVLYEDDCIIAKKTVRKIYDNNPRTEFTIKELV